MHILQADLFITYKTPHEPSFIRESQSNRATINLSLTFLEYAFLVFSRIEIDSQLRNRKQNFFHFNLTPNSTKDFNTWLNKTFEYREKSLQLTDLAQLIFAIHAKAINLFSNGQADRFAKHKYLDKQLKELDELKDERAKKWLASYHPQNLLKDNPDKLPLDYLLNNNPYRLDESLLIKSLWELEKFALMEKSFREKAASRSKARTNRKSGYSPVFLRQDFILFLKIIPDITSINPYVEWAGQNFFIEDSK